MCSSVTCKPRRNLINMASSSMNPVSTESSNISLSSTLSLPRSCQKCVASKIENLIEYSYIPEFAQINESQFLVMSPYDLQVENFFHQKH